MNNVKIENINQNQYTVENKNVKAPQNNFTSEGRKKLLEERIISLVFKNPSNITLIKEEDYKLFCEVNGKFLENLNKVALPVLNSAEDEKEEKLKAMFADISQTEEYKNAFGVLSLMAEANEDIDDPEEVELCLFQLKRLELKNELGRLSGEIKNDPNQASQDHLKAFDKKAKELHSK